MNRDTYERYYKVPCPECGELMYHTAKSCLKCSQKKAKPSNHRKIPCPQCGRPMLSTSKMCRVCDTGLDIHLAPGFEKHRDDLPHPNWELATRDFMLQFTGLFLGEGCIHGRVNNSTGTLSISLAIKLRADDSSALEYIQDILGGAFRVDERPGHSPEASWYITNMKDVGDILAIMLQYCNVPMRKSKEIELALEYINWRNSVDFHNLDKEIVHSYYERLKELKRLHI